MEAIVECCAGLDVHQATVVACLNNGRAGARSAVAMESARLAPNSVVSIYPWKETEDQIAEAWRHVQGLLRAHASAMAAE